MDSSSEHGWQEGHPRRWPLKVDKNRRSEEETRRSLRCSRGEAATVFSRQTGILGLIVSQISVGDILNT